MQTHVIVNTNVCVAVFLDFSCAYYHRIHLHGRMYVTPNFVNFRSNVLGYVTLVKVPCAEITDIAKRNSAMVVPNAIEITTDKASVSVVYCN